MGEDTVCPVKRICDNCGRVVPVKEQMYSLRIEMFARAEPLVFTSQDLEQAPGPQMELLLKELEKVDVEEATDQVYETYGFDLCGRCRGKFHRRMKERSGAEKGE
jgi:hypothetical protein